MPPRQGKRPAWDKPSPFLTDLADWEAFDILTADSTVPGLVEEAVDAWAQLEPDVRDYVKARLQVNTLLATDMMLRYLNRHTGLLQSIQTGTRLTVRELQELKAYDDEYDDEEAPQYEEEPSQYEARGGEYDETPMSHEDEAHYASMEGVHIVDGPSNGGNGMGVDPFAALDASPTGVAMANEGADEAAFSMALPPEPAPEPTPEPRKRNAKGHFVGAKKGKKVKKPDVLDGDGNEVRPGS